MLAVTKCDECGREGSLNVSYKHNVLINYCNECGNLHTKEWNYNFCNSECFCNWHVDNEVENNGVPCKDCHGKGSDLNGECDTCKGGGKIRGTKKRGFQQEGNNE